MRAVLSKDAVTTRSWAIDHYDRAGAPNFPTISAIVTCPILVGLHHRNARIEIDWWQNGACTPLIRLSGAR